MNNFGAERGCFSAFFGRSSRSLLSNISPQLISVEVDSPGDSGHWRNAGVVYEQKELTAQLTPSFMGPRAIIV